MILEGYRHTDHRGSITYNNDFDISQVKRIYTIENNSTEFIRGWQGHQIEQRWFACIKGSFEISVIVLDSFDKPSTDLKQQIYQLDEQVLSYLHIASGCITAIRALKPDSKLLVLADFGLGEIQDEYRFELDYFNEKVLEKNE